MTAEDLPGQGMPAEELLAAVRARRDRDADWRGGRTFSLVYHPDHPELEKLQERVALEYLHENALNPFAFPSLTEMDAEVVSWGSSLMHGPGHGRMSSGGTESIFLAVQTAREEWMARAPAGPAAGVSDGPASASGPPAGAPDRAAGAGALGGGPVLLTADTVHPAFAKAATYLAVEHVKVPVGTDGRADVGAMTDAMDRLGDRVALVVGSAPCYPYGVIDPIPELAAAASERGLLFHTDACLGGWLLPFWEELGRPVPPWDFRVEGVTSISADVHKYGWTIKGASLVLYRDEALLRRQFFLYDGWPGGLYGSATTAGTRPAAPIAVAWATIRHLGRDGYLRLARQVADVTDVFRSGIEGIEGLALTHQPDMSVMEIGATPGGAGHDTAGGAGHDTAGGAGHDDTPAGVDIGAVGDVMDDRGWHLDRQQGGLHLMLWPYHLKVADRFLSDLAEAAAAHTPSRGKAATYGGIA